MRLKRNVPVIVAWRSSGGKDLLYLVGRFCGLCAVHLLRHSRNLRKRENPASLPSSAFWDDIAGRKWLKMNLAPSDPEPAVMNRE